MCFEFPQNSLRLCALTEPAVACNDVIISDTCYAYSITFNCDWYNSPPSGYRRDGYEGCGILCRPRYRAEWTCPDLASCAATPANCVCPSGYYSNSCNGTFEPLAPRYWRHSRALLDKNHLTRCESSRHVVIQPLLFPPSCSSLRNSGRLLHGKRQEFDSVWILLYRVQR
jgi:hypothetical protein